MNCSYKSLTSPKEKTLTPSVHFPISTPRLDETLGLWLYGNDKLLTSNCGFVSLAFGNVTNRTDLDEIELQSEELVLSGKTLVCGIHNAGHQRAAVVPLRWGAPRILCVSGGFYHHLGPVLKEELFRMARLWRYEFDPTTDLVVSRRAPDKKPTFSNLNPTIDRLIERLAS